MQVTPDSIRDVGSPPRQDQQADRSGSTRHRDDLHHAAQAMRSVTAHARTADSGSSSTRWRAELFWPDILLWSFLPAPAQSPAPCPMARCGPSVTALTGGPAVKMQAQLMPPQRQRRRVNHFRYRPRHQRDEYSDAIDACRKSAATSQQP